MDGTNGSFLTGAAAAPTQRIRTQAGADHPKSSELLPPGDERQDGGPAGGIVGTNGAATVPVCLALLALVAAGCTVNALSILHEAARQGEAIVRWRPWATEYSSLLGFAAALPVPVWIERRVRGGKPAAGIVAMILAGSVLFSAIHVGTMVAAREMIWALVGLDYSFDLRTDWLYEYRKDLIGYAVALLLLAAVRLAAPRSREQGQPEGAGCLIRLPDGRREAAVDPAALVAVRGGGNYVELIFAGTGRRLLRTTLAATERTLADHGFRRTHKSWLVRVDAVDSITRTPAGDFLLKFGNGLEAPLSRRHRSELREIRGALGDLLEPRLI